MASRTTAGGTIAVSPASTLPPTHPLIVELASLRQQLQQYHKAAHQSSIQLQGSRLQLDIAKERLATLEGSESALRKEIELLRANPAPPPLQPTSTALTELSLAHRRLSAKLDLTEAQLSSTSLELAASKQEITRLAREREGDRATINEFRRVEDDREEQIAWERAERRKAEEQKKLCDLALQEYSTLVRSLDPSAVPSEIPSTTASKNILHSAPDLFSDPEQVDKPAAPTSSTTTSSETISNLLIGQRGVHRLFTDFTSTLTAKEKALHSAHAKIEQLELRMETLQSQLDSETSQRVTAQNERDIALRDDGSAAKVVERYMTFTQKTHGTVHMHLDNLRKRSSATQATLRGEITALRTLLAAETARAEKLRAALDEMSEGFSREAAGRRREVALRLKMLSIEETRARRIEAWLDKVRRARDGAEGAVVEPDILESLLDEGIEAVDKDRPVTQEPRSWRRVFRKKKAVPVALAQDGLEESVARVLLAEELVNTLVQDLQEETERRVDLEKQRVEWLAKEAAEGVHPALTSDGEVMFDGYDDHEGESGDEVKQGEDETQTEAPADVATTPPELPETPPLLPDLRSLFEPLTERYEPLQKGLHDLSHSLSSLRSSDATVATQRNLLGVKRSEHILHSLLDSIHEVIEDARVDVEIALADEERVFRGFEALLGVGKSGAVQGKQVIQDAENYITERKEWDGYDKLQKRIEDVESDLTNIKRVVHEMEGLEVDDDAAPTTWSEVELKTVAVPTRALPLPDVDVKRRGANLLSGVGNVGRSFSSGIIRAPRKVGSFAGGLYRGPNGKVPTSPRLDGKDAEAPLKNDVDDVE